MQAASLIHPVLCHTGAAFSSVFMPRPSEVKYRRGEERGREKGWCDKKVSDDCCILQERDSVDACSLWKCIAGFLKRKRDRQIAGQRRGRCLCVAVVTEPYHDSLSKTRPLSTHTLTLLCPCTVSQASWVVAHWSDWPDCTATPDVVI